MLGERCFDYDRSDHTKLLAPILVLSRKSIVEHLSAGHDVVLDHGLGRRVEREEFQQLAEEHGSGWELLCFGADMSTLRSRCQQRSALPGTVPISNEVLVYLVARWERPSGEGETVVVTD